MLETASSLANGTVAGVVPREMDMLPRPVRSNLGLLLCLAAIAYCFFVGMPHLLYDYTGPGCGRPCPHPSVCIYRGFQGEERYYPDRRGSEQCPVIKTFPLRF